MEDIIEKYLRANRSCNVSETVITRNGAVLRDFFRYVENGGWEITVKDTREPEAKK